MAAFVAQSDGMASPGLKNLHVPLPPSLYERLRAEAQRSGHPATVLARKAIDRWLDASRRAATHAEIARYAAERAGTAADLDPGLEAAAIEQLVARPRRRG